MSEANKNTGVQADDKAQTPKKGTQQKPKETSDKNVKKENFIKRGYKAAKKKASEHPFVTAFAGAVFGSATTVGAGYIGKKVVENHRAKKQATYIQEDDTLNPNV